jgi:cell division septation protein DedD
VKERLTGAIILVALIVLLVPELLTGPVGSATRSQAVASSIEGPPLRSYTIKLADEARLRDASAHSGPEQPAPLPPAPAPAATATPAPPAAQEPRSAPTASPATTAPAAHAGPGAGAAAAAQPGSAETSGGYLVQLGSFGSRANAERLAKKVRTQGFTVSVSQGSSGHLYRVRVGPAHDRAAAGELAQQLRAHGHSGTIVPQ